MVGEVVRLQENTPLTRVNQRISIAPNGQERAIAKREKKTNKHRRVYIQMYIFGEKLPGELCNWQEVALYSIDRASMRASANVPAPPGGALFGQRTGKRGHVNLSCFTFFVTNLTVENWSAFVKPVEHRFVRRSHVGPPCQPSLTDAAAALRSDRVATRRTPGGRLLRRYKSYKVTPMVSGREKRAKVSLFCVDFK